MEIVNKMSENQIKKNMIAKYMSLFEDSKGGIFTDKTRRRLLGVQGLSGREKTKSDFWYDRRKNVESAFYDLELFVEAAGNENVNRVFTSKRVEPIFRRLLYSPVVRSDDPELERAEIAKALIKVGFDYLQYMKREHITASHSQTIDHAIDLSMYLAELFKSESDRRFISKVKPLGIIGG